MRPIVNRLKVKTSEVLRLKGNRTGVPMIRAVCFAKSYHSYMEDNDQMALIVNIERVAINGLKDTKPVVSGAERFVFEFRSIGILGGGLCPENNKSALMKMNVR